LRRAAPLGFSGDFEPAEKLFNGTGDAAGFETGAQA